MSLKRDGEQTNPADRLDHVLEQDVVNTHAHAVYIVNALDSLLYHTMTSSCLEVCPFTTLFKL